MRGRLRIKRRLRISQKLKRMLLEYNSLNNLQQLNRELYQGLHLIFHKVYSLNQGALFRRDNRISMKQYSLKVDRIIGNNLAQEYKIMQGQLQRHMTKPKCKPKLKAAWLLDLPNNPKTHRILNPIVVQFLVLLKIYPTPNHKIYREASNIFNKSNSLMQEDLMTTDNLLNKLHSQPTANFRLTNQLSQIFRTSRCLLRLQLPIGP